MAEAAAKARAVVHGRITSKATRDPIPGAEVRAGLVWGGDTLTAATVQSDGSGGYRAQLTWSGVERPRLFVEVRAPGCRLSRWPFSVMLEVGGNPQILTVKDGDERTVDVTLEEGFAVEITVTTPQGFPLPDVESTVVCTSSESNYCYWPVLYSLLATEHAAPKTDAHGRVTWHGFASRLLRTERYVIALRHPDYVEHLIQGPEDMPRDGSLLKIQVQMAHGGSLAGRITDRETGAPVVNARVTAIYQDETGAVPVANDVEKASWTDASGRYTIIGLKPGRYTLRASHPQWMETVAEGVSVATKGATADLALDRGARITGRVFDAAGQPARGAVVRAFWMDRAARGGLVSHTQAADADADGSFVLAGLPASGEIEIAARSGERDVLYGYRRVAACNQDVILDARDVVTLAGYLVDKATGRPVPHRIHCAAYTAPGRRFLCTGHGDRPDGCFRVNVPPGHVALAVQAFQHSYGLLEITAERGTNQEALKIVGEDAARVVVKVMDRRSLMPVPGAVVHFLPTENIWRTCFTDEADADGLARIEGVSPGSANLQVIAKGYRTAVIREIGAFGDEQRPLVVELDREGGPQLPSAERRALADQRIPPRRALPRGRDNGK